MKKALLIISSICVAACALTACNLSCADDGTSKDYNKFNSMLEAGYSKIVITINNTFTDEDVTLTSEYTVRYAQSEMVVNYKVERFSEFTLEHPATELKTVYEGSAVIVGGIISGGEEVELTADIATLNFDFNKKYFENVTISETFFAADVADAGSFLGTEIDCTDMHVVAGFDEVFKSITINYTQGKNEVEYKYIFTN